MIELQCINKILNEKKLQFFIDSGITPDFFPIYKKEYLFILKHYEKYKVVPDKTTFINSFQTFKLYDVRESDQYVLDKLRESYLYNTSLPFLQKGAEIFSENANAGVDYIIKHFQNLRTDYGIVGTDYVKNARERYLDVMDRVKNPNKNFFSTGFKELDKIVGGFQRGEEFVVLFGRSASSKSWIGSKFALEVWKQGANVGIISPEMTPKSLGYRIDTLNSHISNYGLVLGREFNEEEAYKQYLTEIQKMKNKLLIANLNDFSKEVTVSKIRAWVKSQSLDFIFIDGISYLKDERSRNGDNDRTRLTNISEDLMGLSIELGIAVIVVVQANRTSVSKDEKDSAPELHHIYNADGIGHNATRAFSLRIKDGVLELKVPKNRYGTMGNVLLYNISLNTGRFDYVPNDKSGIEEDKQIIEELMEQADEQLEDIF